MNQPLDQSAEAIRFGEWCNEHIEVHDSEGNIEPQGIASKVDFLERAIELWRFHTGNDENKVPFEVLLQSPFVVEDEQVQFQVPPHLGNLDAGTPATRLQPRLLMFLLLYHREEYEVYEIIEKFIDKIRSELSVLDFKKTKTGTTRCFTNTRFAAHTLRSFGFLRFTQREAFKTWVLSLPGFLVASRVVEYSNNWSIDSNEKLRRSVVHPEVLNANQALTTYDQFVNQLRLICEPNVDVFATFDDVLRQSHSLLDEYWKILRKDGMNKDDRKAETERQLKKLDSLPDIEQFYAEFSKCVNVEQLLKDIGE